MDIGLEKREKRKKTFPEFSFSLSRMEENGRHEFKKKEERKTFWQDENSNGQADSYSLKYLEEKQDLQKKKRRSERFIPLEFIVRG